MTFVLFVVFLALAFDFINGFHDAANSIATVVGTRVLTPKKAVIWAAFFNFAAAFSLETRVAKTISKDIVNPAVVDPLLIFAALVGAIVWNLVTWWWALPSSSSHALIGGFAGAALVKAGPASLVPKGLGKTVVFIVRSMGMRITALRPISGSCAEFAGAVTLIGASLGGVPVSTTHTITGAIMGVGSVRRFSAVRWGVARSIVIAWILTIPASAGVAALVWLCLSALKR